MSVHEQEGTDDMMPIVRRTTEARRGREDYWLLGTFLGLLSVGCGKTATAELPPTNEGGADASTDAADAGASAPDDASVDAGTAAESGSPADAGSNSEAGGEPDATDSGSRSDASDAADAADAGDATTEDAATPIPCDETTSCANPINLGSIWGGVAGGANEVVGVNGNKSAWYLIAIDPYPGLTSSNIVNEVADVYTIAGQVFDMDIYVTTTPSSLGTCSQPVASGLGSASAPAQAYFQFPATSYSPMAWVTVHVIAHAGTQCTVGAGYNFEVKAD